jgi:hypothetical protein
MPKYKGQRLVNGISILILGRERQAPRPTPTGRLPGGRATRRAMSTWIRMLSIPHHFQAG